MSSCRRWVCVETFHSDCWVVGVGWGRWMELGEIRWLGIIELCV